LSYSCVFEDDEELEEELSSDSQTIADSKSPSVEPAWQRHLKLVKGGIKQSQITATRWSQQRQIVYVIDADATRARGRLTFDIGYREQTKKGDWSKFKAKRINIASIPTLRDPADIKILSLLHGAKEYLYSYNYGYELLFSHCSVPPESQTVLLPLMCSTERCFLRAADGVGTAPVHWDEDARWQLTLGLRPVEAQTAYQISASITNGTEQLNAASLPVLVDGLVITSELRAGRILTRNVKAWAPLLNPEIPLMVPMEEGAAFIAEVLALPAAISLDLPNELRYETVKALPSPYLRVRRPENGFQLQGASGAHLEVDLFFNYEGAAINYFDSRPGVYESNSRLLLTRDADYESNAVRLLGTLGVREQNPEHVTEPTFVLAPKKLPQVVKTLLREGWRIEAEGKLYRKAGRASLSVSSGIDWFELHGEVDYGDGVVAKLPELLRALKRGESMVQLSDGGYGLLPEEWLSRYGSLASLGEPAEDHLRFKPAQTGILDALLATQPEVKTDEVFARVLSEWRNFKGIKPLAPPRTFVGALRHYQCEALGWFRFLESFGFGGCLADDMGLGKTVQVLALLESRRTARRKLKKDDAAKRPRPSLVVVPRSLIFNWEQEARRFTPQLRVLTHTGADRTRGTAHLKDFDLVLTTYGTLRRDVIDFQTAHFDYVILDESQAIKNAKTESAKAVRLLNAKNRLALSGTPIENHIGELWSLFEFLNPGMLGAASVFQTDIDAGRAANAEMRSSLGRALRPFFLRRKKEQVAKELPEKIEQTIYCEMDTVQRRQYEELREHYRESLLSSVDRLGMGRAKIQILEALLRLRQTACHPALLTKREEDGPNAKLDVLLPRLLDIVAEGHKALVFSQFTSFLAIVRRRLELERISCEYLDGKTSDRETPVARFQNDPSCQLFLISLKAGGQGLNLTAADYVFLLDPWWNPAVEAQAIDRAHRIGQTKQVFACRLITRDTVEEKVVELQATKRELADAIISEDNSLLKTITADELLLLLS
jgi:superfamily II DNA or RNA helicase